MASAQPETQKVVPSCYAYSTSLHFREEPCERANIHIQLKEKNLGLRKVKELTQDRCSTSRGSGSGDLGSTSLHSHFSRASPPGFSELSPCQRDKDLAVFSGTVRGELHVPMRSRLETPSHPPAHTHTAPVQPNQWNNDVEFEYGVFFWGGG